ncbi:hypothetical protein AGMMS49992_09080 [Clostridia bacterium]|nr:hypothetical protein AGMMS49992_09080 [Clostridia bacterium]
MSAVATNYIDDIIIISIVTGVWTLDNETNELIIIETEALTSTIEFWKVNELSPITRIIGECDSVINSMRIHPNGKLLGVTTINGSALLWELYYDSSGLIRCTNIVAWDGGISSIAFFSCITDNLSESEKRQQERGVFLGFSYGKIQSNEIYKRDKSIEDNCSEYIIYIYTNYTGHKPYVYDISISERNNRIIGAYSDGCIREWDLKDKITLHTYYTENPSFVYCVEYSPNGDFFASGHSNGSIWLWDSSTNLPICQLKDNDRNAHDETVRDLKFTNDGRLISCANDKTIKVWNIETQEVVAILKGHSDFVKCLLYYEDDNIKRIVSGSTDTSIIIWDSTNTKNCTALPPLRKHRNRIRCPTWLPRPARQPSHLYLSLNIQATANQQTSPDDRGYFC